MSNPAEQRRTQWDKDAAQVVAAAEQICQLWSQKDISIDNVRAREIFDVAEFTAKNPFWWTQGASNADEWLEHARQFALRHPRYDSVFTEPIVANYVDDTHADAHIVFETRNAPPGIVRISMTVMKFHKKNGRWMCYNSETVHGHQTLAFARGT